MTDQSNGQTPPEGQNAPAAGEVTKPAGVTVTAEELAEYKAAKEQNEKAKAIFEELGLTGTDNIAEGVDMLADIAGRKVIEGDKTNPAPAANPPNPATPATPPAPADNPELTRIGQMSADAFIRAQFGEYAYDQMNKPADQRLNIPKEDLMKTLKGPDGALVTHMMNQDRDGKRFGGNIFNAAEYVIKVTTGKTASPGNPAQPNAALAAAKGTATAEAGASVPGSGGGNEPRAITADDIVPDTPYTPGKD
jgi:hypothetical protein